VPVVIISAHDGQRLRRQLRELDAVAEKAAMNYTSASAPPSSSLPPTLVGSGMVGVGVGGGFIGSAEVVSPLDGASLLSPRTLFLTF
jgi:hypothetical protein